MVLLDDARTKAYQMIESLSIEKSLESFIDAKFNPTDPLANKRSASRVYHGIY